MNHAKNMNKDLVLIQANNERKASNIKNRSLAIRRLKEILTKKVDWSSVVCIESQVNCSGLNRSKVSDHTKVDSAFFHQHWDYSCGAWHAQRCQGSTHLDEHSSTIVRWTKVGDLIQCPPCATAKKSAICYSKDSDQGTPPTLTSAIHDLLQKDVYRLFVK